MASSGKWDAARKLLQGVMDTVDKRLQNSGSQNAPQQACSSSQQGTVMQAGSGQQNYSFSPNPESSGLCGSSLRPMLSPYTEHSNLFNFKPSLSSKVAKRGRGKTPAGRPPKQHKASFWTKESICLRYTDQLKAPDTEEKMKLAQMGLGFKEIKFDTDGGALHIHSAIISAYPELDFCGGYCLMRLGSGSSDLVTIEPPRGGLNVRYLRDILKSAKLFIRPLQRDIEEKGDKEPDTDDFSPMEICLSCSKTFPLHQLQVHVESGECKQAENRNQSDDLSPPLVKQLKTEQMPDSVPCVGAVVPAAVKTQSETYLKYVDLDVIEVSSDEDAGCKADSDDGCLEIAVMQSLQEHKSELSVDALLMEHKEENMHRDPMKSYCIRVRRRRLWEDGCEELRRDFDVKRHLRVKFIGEKGADGGGPRREFFFRMIDAMGRQNMLFEGPENCRSPTHNFMALRAKDYYLLGKIIVLSILSGGPAPKFFSKPALEYLFYGHVIGTRANVTLIADKEVQEKMLKIVDEANEHEYRKMLSGSNYDFLFDCGVIIRSDTAKIAEKESVISAVCHHYLVAGILGELEQIRMGLCTLNFIKLMEKYPGQIMCLFQPSTVPLSAEQLEDMFHVNYSEIGSNQRSVEEQIVFNFIKFLRDIEEGKLTSPSLGEILMCLTGCFDIPPLGFPDTLTLSFTLSPTPHFSTCALEAVLPLNLPVEYEQFVDRLCFFMMNSPNFGSA